MLFEKCMEMVIRMGNDERLTFVHVSLLVALLNKWGESNKEDSFNVNRRELMRLSHIKNIVSYHKIIKSLVYLGYIEYYPSYDPFFGSLIRIKW